LDELTPEVASRPYTFCDGDFAFVAACSGDLPGPDAALPDVTAVADLSMPAPDLRGDPNDILGTLGGACGVLAPLLHSPSPSLFDNNLTFASGEMHDRSSLSPDGQILYDTPNAGGSSTATWA
jgi:hypothetical protein